MKILLAVDGSSCSDTAVEEVARRPWPQGSSVKVLTAFELPTPPTPEAWALPINYFQEMDIALRKQAEDMVDPPVTAGSTDRFQVRLEIRANLCGNFRRIAA